MIDRPRGSHVPGSADAPSSTETYLRVPEDLVVLAARDDSAGILLRYPYEAPRTINGDALRLLRWLAHEQCSRFDAALKLQRQLPSMSWSTALAKLDGFVLQFSSVTGSRWAEKPAVHPMVCNRMSASRPLLRLYLELTQRCDLACAHCLTARPRVEKGLPELSREQVFDLVDQAAELGCMELDVSGGEVRLREDLVPILEHISARGMYITLYTNGAAADPTWIDALKGLRITSLVFSVDSVDPEVHDEFRGIKGSLLRTLGSMRAAADAGFSIRVNTAMCDDTEGSVGLTVQMMLRLRRVASIVVAPVIPLGRARRRPELMPSAKRYGGLMRELFGEALRAAETHSSAGAPVCGVGDSLLFVSAKGEIGACPTLTGAEDQGFYFGNIRDRTLFEAWESYIGTHPVDGMRCRLQDSCAASSRCGGGCRSRALVSFGDLKAPDFFSCAFFAPENLA